MTLLTPVQFLKAQQELPAGTRLDMLVSILRGPDGCPWDQKQSAASILEFLIGEAHELQEALRRDEPTKIIEEFGDLAFTFTFLKQTLESRAPIASAVESVVEKMIVRHPHVFAPDTAGAIPDREIRRQWESLKRAEDSLGSLRLDRDLPSSLPTWSKAAKVLSRARDSGFRYPNPEAAWEKVGEEWDELQEALDGGDPERQQEEVGDLLLALLTATTESALDAERALMGSVRTLADRLEQVEVLAGRPLSEIPPSELPTLYSQARGDDPLAQAYFNHCGVSRWPPEVRRSVHRAARQIAREGLPAALRLRDERELLREKIARLVQGKADQVVLVPNVSSAALGVGYCLDWRPGDAILLGREEFPSNVIPWKLAAAQFELEVHEFDDDSLRHSPESAWENLKELLNRVRPRLLALSAVSYWSGYRLPIARIGELCRSVGCLLFIDAIQALGTVPVVVSEGIDFLAGGSHKSLLSPEGAGFLVVSPPARDHWIPRFGSWLSLPDPVDFLVEGRDDCAPNKKAPRKHDPSVLESGSINCLGYAGLSGALDFLHEHGIERIADKIQGLHDGLESGLQGLGFRSLRAANPACRSSILSFEPPAGVDLPRLAQDLSQRSIQVGTPNGRLRFGFHLFNSQADIDRVLATMPTLLR